MRNYLRPKPPGSVKTPISSQKRREHLRGGVERPHNSWRTVQNDGGVSQPVPCRCPQRQARLATSFQDQRSPGDFGFDGYGLGKAFQRCCRLISFGGKSNAIAQLPGNYAGSKSATSARSSFNSFSVAAILALLKSLSGTPWTISKSLPLLRMG